MNLVQNPVFTIVVLLAAVVCIVVYRLICHHLKRKIERLTCENQEAAHSIDQLASFVDLIRRRSPDTEGDPDVQRLAAQVLSEAALYRRYRSKHSPNIDLLMQDLEEMAGPYGPRLKLHTQKG
jgi:hypothetical protein